MDATKAEPHATTTERISDRELLVTRKVDAPARMVFAAWTRPELVLRWWAPKSFGITLLSCEIDARTGGSYRYVFGHPAAPEPLVFFGKYTEVVADARLVWTNEENDEGPISTATFAEKDGGTQVVLHELYPFRKALDEALASGSTGAWPEQFIDLDALVADPHVGLAG